MSRIANSYTNDQVKEILQKACDRDWKDETLYQTAVIASNAIYWRDREIASLKKWQENLRRVLRMNTQYMDPNIDHFYSLADALAFATDGEEKS